MNMEGVVKMMKLIRKREVRSGSLWIRTGNQRELEFQSGTATRWTEIYSFLISDKFFVQLNAKSRAEIQAFVGDIYDELMGKLQIQNRDIPRKEQATKNRHEDTSTRFDFLLLDTVGQLLTELREIENRGAFSLEDISVVELFPKTRESLRRTLDSFSTSELETEEAKEMLGGEAKGTVRSEVYNFLDLISENVMKLKSDSKLRISCHSRDEIQIHMDNMLSEVTNLLLMMEISVDEPAMEKMGVKGIQIRTDDKGESTLETQAPRNLDFQLKSILECLKQIHTVLVGNQNRSYKDVLESKSISELFKETRDSLTKIKVDTEIKAAREMDGTPQEISLDAVSGAQVSQRVSSSELEIEEDSEMGGEAKGSDEVWLRILNSGLEIEEDSEMGREAKGSDEVSPGISTSTETKLEMKEAKGIPEEGKMHKVLTEEESFDRYRCRWVSGCSALYGTFTETTTLSPMHFTHCTPRYTPFASFIASTLQIYSIRVTEINKKLGLKWPLQVYGVVAARDTVDHNRNILFSRRRDDCQELNEQDPFLRLTGPSRAIVTEEPVHVEIELKAKGTTKSEDRVLMSKVWYYSDKLCTLYTPLAGQFCTLVLSSEELEKSVQATIVAVQITKGKPGLFEYGGRLVCSSPPREGILPDSKHITAPSFRQVVLEDGAIDVCSNGYLALSRQVVSVELCGRLEVLICEYSQSQGIAEHCRVSIKAQNCNVTQHKCRLGSSELEISVAWSRLVRGKGSISMEGKVRL